jgi:hypothetical protein
MSTTANAKGRNISCKKKCRKALCLLLRKGEDVLKGTESGFLL